MLALLLPSGLGGRPLRLELRPDKRVAILCFTGCHLVAQELRVDAEALKELGEHLGVGGLAPEDGGARRPTTRHSFTIVAS